MDDYLSKQIITYMGNKRKILPYIEEIILKLEKEKGSKLKIGEGFSGSGIVSRLLKKHACELYTNDIAGYSETLNKCYLSNVNKDDEIKIEEYITKANNYADKRTKFTDKFIVGNWSPEGTIDKDDRLYFTKENGERIDILRNYIEKIPEKYQSFLLAPLLVECSIHNNTNGHFASYYKEQYGGSKNIDLKRITEKITLKKPLFYNSQCKIKIDRKDVNEWVKNIPKMDVIYYDPPYNKHPYNIYYFLLDIINNWKKVEVPNTTRGQPLNWNKSLYNSISKAEKIFDDLINNTNASNILISYNNNGIISEKNMKKILEKYGKVEKIELEHKTYNRLKGIAEYKRKSEKEKINEFIWLLKKNIR